MFNRKLIETLKQTINSLEEDLDNEKAKNKYLTRDLIILLNNASRDRAKIKDYENNIELLFNELTPKKRELARPTNQN